MKPWGSPFGKLKTSSQQPVPDYFCAHFDKKMPKAFSLNDREKLLSTELIEMRCTELVEVYRRIKRLPPFFNQTITSLELRKNNKRNKPKVL